VEDGHRVRQRRQAEIAIERVSERRGVAPARRQIDLALLAGGDRPDAVGVAAEVQLAAPALPAAGGMQECGGETPLGLELIVESVGTRRGADGNAACAHLLLPDLELSELDAEWVVLQPGDRAMRVRAYGS